MSEKRMIWADKRQREMIRNYFPEYKGGYNQS